MAPHDPPLARTTPVVATVQPVLNAGASIPVASATAVVVQPATCQAAQPYALVEERTAHVEAYVVAVHPPFLSRANFFPQLRGCAATWRYACGRKILWSYVLLHCYRAAPCFLASCHVRAVLPVRQAQKGRLYLKCSARS